MDKDKWVGKPYLQTHQVIIFTRKFLQLLGRDFDEEFNEWKHRQLITNVQDSIIEN